MELIQIGYTKKAHGVKGEVKVHIDTPFLDDAKKAEVFFIETKGQALPYFLEKLQFGNQIIAKFEDVASKEDAAQITGQNLYLREEDISEQESQEFDLDKDFAFFKGFLIKDMEHGDIGLISEVVEYPQQIMAFVELEDREIIIPLNEFFIQDIDLDNNIILMELPDGILDL
ncbi:MAG: ribosome maturation factor RimM [Saprospiraceae bacterium]|nr:ribosome maturation factor RimM [Saprospiraceae bacterium]